MPIVVVAAVVVVAFVTFAVVAFQPDVAVVDSSWTCAAAACTVDSAGHPFVRSSYLDRMIVP